MNTPTFARAPRSAMFALALLAFTPSQLPAQGIVEVWGGDGLPAPTDPPTEESFVLIGSGGNHALALRPNGTIVAWGLDNQGQVSNAPQGPGYVDVTGGLLSSLALHSDGSIAGWGGDGYGIVSQAPTGLGHKAIAARAFAAIALRADGSIVGWGRDDYGHLSNPPGGTGFTAVATPGGAAAAALRADGSILAWGEDFDQIVSGAPTGVGHTSLEAGLGHMVALRSDGSIVSWGNDMSGQVSDTPSGTGFVQVAAGMHSSVALRADGTVVSWGSDSGGVIDGGQVTDSPLGAGYTMVAGGFVHHLALRGANSGGSYCFGDGTGATCPCNGFGAPGSGCANSSGNGAQLAAVGGAYVVGDSFRLNVTGVPGAKPGLLLRGSNQVNGGAGNPAGDGLLCTTGNTARSHVQVTSATGETTFTEFAGSSFGAASYGPGITTNYQFWYRDPANTCSGSSFNFTNAWTVIWMP